ncbi:sensor domain-containing phosphodiesterase [Azospirillum rugosum]|uniref:EAL domain-containing protein (Putative c-di-GMP-specific phosphodiesterase class I) n=1 Tax=Azospirillum rugosum TaxID=416170 RepID=A0ABS4SJR4_9PROT|nr:EAL domain-containing protein [Azospirillum rugosum]MBP2292192.1 EAL domain-containing protein (putative c-di-GMP-specific phosphodiesterase class I) [Azospirillum rugosum]MDQ0525672.1 EAL domain-containing protein (putative c-di-GMP-specific phosphodiesterase class I) [Azospirillum rugosum]
MPHLAHEPPRRPTSATTVSVRRQPSYRERDRFVGFAFAAADLLIETDTKGVIQFCAGARCRLTTGDVAGLVGSSLLDLVAPSDRKYVNVLMKRIQDKARIKPARVVFQGCDGQRFTALLGGCRLDSCPGSLFLTILLSSGPRATQEALTVAGQLLDSHAFGNILEERIIRAREKGLDHGLTLLLVEGLQSMVDALPEGAADEVKQGIDAYLRAISADGDSAGRLATDRYGIVHASDIDGQEVQSHIAQIIHNAGGELPGGIRTWSLDVADEKLDAADAARALVYTVQAFASAQGGDFTISSLEDGAKRMLSDAVDRIGRLRATIEKRDFFVVYQPIVDIGTQAVHHLEALTRVEGMPSPADFITFAEDVGLIYDFDLLLTQSVLDTMQTYRKEPTLPDVAINLSAKTLMSPIFLRQFQAVTEPYGDLARKLLVEVTETVVVTDIARLNEVLQKLRTAGFRICLDDVGAGSTSFQSLYGIQADFAKIDGKFVRGAVENARDMAMLRSMVDVCRQLGLGLIGEQVEGPEHAELLTDLGVSLAQGYLYSRPSRDFAYFAKDWSKMGGKGGKILWKS